MELTIHVSNYKPPHETYNNLIRLKENSEQDLQLVDTILQMLTSKESYEEKLTLLGKNQLEILISSCAGSFEFKIKQTTGVYRGSKEPSYEIEADFRNILHKFDVLKRIVSFATDYDQDSFVESEIYVDEDAESLDAELGIKDEFDYEIAPFLALQLHKKKTDEEILDILEEADFDGCTYYYDNISKTYFLLVYYLSDYKQEKETPTEGAQNFINKVVTLIEANESKRIFTSHKAGFRKIRLARNERGNPEEGYEGYLQKLFYEKERIGEVN